MTRSWHFIHIPKNAGSTINDSLPKDFKKKYYGLCWGRGQIDKYLKQNNIEYDENCHKTFVNRATVSIDHLTLSELLLYKIITKEELMDVETIVVIRDPIDRFISMCNMQKKEPKNLINSLKRFSRMPHPREWHHQHCRTQTSFFEGLDFDINLKLIDFKDTKAIVNAFKKHGVDVDMDKRVFASKKDEEEYEKKYSKENLDENDLNFLNDYFSKDIELYNNL